jgi:hypothetical protein
MDNVQNCDSYTKITALTANYFRPPGFTCNLTLLMIQPGVLGKFKNFNDLFGTRTPDLPAYSIAPQPSTLPRVVSVKLRMFLRIFIN